MTEGGREIERGVARAGGEEMDGEEMDGGLGDPGSRLEDRVACGLWSVACGVGGVFWQLSRGKRSCREGDWREGVDGGGPRQI